ncbi:MAG: DUF1593 domain-containing protein [Myxococcota bacterium]|nr:DUF1593 domain-containing protein [Myxococcota bacterium]
MANIWKSVFLLATVGHALGVACSGSPPEGATQPDASTASNGSRSAAEAGDYDALAVPVGVPADGSLAANNPDAGGLDAASYDHAVGPMPEAGLVDGPSRAPGQSDAATMADGGPSPGDAGGANAVANPRVIVLTDIGFDPDDQESLVRYLVYSNELDTEALIAITSLYLRTNPREDLIRQEVAAYGQARANLLKHAPGFPDAASLLALTATGQPGYGMAAVGPGKSTAGSQQLIAAIDKPDPRPVWVTIWGGANTLAQALQDVSASRTAADVARFVAKLRVYSISDQDDAGSWIRKTYPQLFYIVSPSTQSPADYPRATWSGISGDRWYKNGPLYKFDMVDNPWLQANVILNHGPLGAVYPPFKWIMEGDTPSYIGLIDNGLGWSSSPAYGGWGGRYSLLQPAGEPHPIWTNDNVVTRDTVAIDDGGTASSDQATIWRWREHYQNDFAARMNWCVADQFAKANHNPLPVLAGDRSTGVVTLSAKSGSVVPLSAAGTSDPDGNAVHVSWWIYREAGTLAAPATLSATDGLTTQVTLPVVSSPGTVHVILQAVDSGNPPLVAYRRAILDVTP